MQRLEVSGSVRPIYGSLGFKRLRGHIQRALLRSHRAQGGHGKGAGRSVSVGRYGGGPSTRHPSVDTENQNMFYLQQLFFF